MAFWVRPHWAWLVILALCGTAQFLARAEVFAREPAVGELLLSRVQAQAIPEGEPQDAGNIDKLLSIPWLKAGDQSKDMPRIFRDRPVFANPSASMRQSRSVRWGLPQKETTWSVIPAPMTPDQATRLASLQPMMRAANRSGGDLIDSGETFTSAGSLAADPRSLYSRLEIEVERARYTINLFGYTEDEKKKLLFSTRVGLGSPEFPTPRGTFFITRIFDDKPLWIPPDSWWAWGQSPSRSVYGGHMMPFFRKLPVKGATVEESGEDLVATRMKMIDGGGYRIHGTDSPWSVGSGQSHGCVRMLNKTVKELADSLKMYVGTTTRGESPNGPYVNLARPVKLTLY